jgi:phosphotransferase system enzyme I (PtsI)
MPQTVERLGRPASPGLAGGPVVLLDRPVAERRAGGRPPRERADLEAAIAEAILAIRRLAAGERGEAADILEFQAAMLEDAELAAPAFGRIAAGADAASAWWEAMEAQIGAYEKAEDEYFRARVADLRDLRDEVARRLAGEAEQRLPGGAVLAGQDVTPSRFLSVDWTHGGGILLFAGSARSHVAMLARSRGVPMIVGVGALDLAGHDTAIVDGDTGRVLLSPGPRDWSAFERARREARAASALEAETPHQPAVTRDGVVVQVMINLAAPGELDRLDPAICDGVGLVRTEFLFGHGPRLPTEEEQYAAYRRIAEWAGNKPVVLRTLDAGGDKPIEGLTVARESNPFLGMRGIRLSLARPDVFGVQLRAMARAAVHGNVKIMLPMVTVPEEIDRSAALLDAAVAELDAEGRACRRPPLGIMVEVPATAIIPRLFARASFFSIGTNDLTQYVTASARDIDAVAALNDPSHPAVISLVRQVADAGRDLGIDVSVCGDMAGDPQHVAALVSAGVRALSVSPGLIGSVKAAIAKADAGGGNG